MREDGFHNVESRHTMSSRWPRIVAAALAGAAVVAGLTATAPAALADESCVDDAAADVSGTEDLLRYCVRTSEGVVTIDLAVDGGTTVAAGGRTVTWQVTGFVEGNPVRFVVRAGASGAVVHYAADAVGAPPVCTAQPVVDTVDRYAVTFAGWCFPRSSSLTVVPTVTTAGGSDGGDVTPSAVPILLGVVDAKYSDLRGPRSALGAPVGPLVTGELGTTQRRRFESGLITQTDAVSSLAFDVVGPRYLLYRRMGEEAGPLGRPISNEYPTFYGTGVISRMQGGLIITGNQTGTHEVHGAISLAYAYQPMYDPFPERSFGFPVTDETSTPDGVGRYNHFTVGSIYWTPSTGAHRVSSELRDVWARMGWERGPLGYPTRGDAPTADGRGRSVRFQGGAVVASPEYGVHEVHGGIAASWQRHGAEQGLLGPPATDELPTPDGRGRFNHFQGGSVYWTPTTGAWEVHGAIRETWSRLGWERGAVGYPVTDELPTPDGRGRFNHFERGSVYWTLTTGAHEVRGGFRAYWSSTGWERGWLGYPLTDEYPVPGGQGQDFENGQLRWEAATGRVTPVRR